MQRFFVSKAHQTLLPKMPKIIPLGGQVTPFWAHWPPAGAKHSLKNLTEIWQKRWRATAIVSDKFLLNLWYHKPEKNTQAHTQGTISSQSSILYRMQQQNATQHNAIQQHATQQDATKQNAAQQHATHQYMCNMQHTAKRHCHRWILCIANLGGIGVKGPYSYPLLIALPIGYESYS